jgi:hypothetical protein
MSDHSRAANLKFPGGNAGDPMTFEFVVPGDGPPELALTLAEMMDKVLDDAFPIVSRRARTQHLSRSTRSSRAYERSLSASAWQRHKPRIRR